jgi:hypothetical protein
MSAVNPYLDLLLTKQALVVCGFLPPGLDREPQNQAWLHVLAHRLEKSLVDDGERLSATDLAKDLFAIWRFRRVGLKRKAALLYQLQRDDAARAEVEGLATGAEGPDVSTSELAEVNAAVLAQLQEASAFSALENAWYAALHAYFYAAQARRFGVSPEELFAFMGANLQSEAADAVASAGDFRSGLRVRGAFNPFTRTITLFPQADLSTFLHESGHLFLEIQFDLTARLLRFAACREPSPAQAELLADSQALLAWFGLQSLDEWQGLDFELRRQYHEKFAVGFEKYLFEGVAPSVCLARIFATFRQWLLALYAHIQHHWSQIELSDEVRGVFDRMLAADAAIHEVRRGGAGLPVVE